ncbi:MAG: DNA primase [Paraglaciecola sp.]|jgi:DNA primase
MAGRIPREFIDDLIARSDIVELIDSRVPLKKAGRNHQACCPFHNEKSPSFTVSQDKQFYHCFGCGAHGNIISFLMEYERLEFPEAIEELAQYHSIDVPREENSAPAPSQAQKQQKANDYELMENVTRFFTQQLKNHPDKNQAIDYLKGRGLSGEIVKSFDIGLAPSQWDGVLSAFGRNPESQQQLLDLKLVSENDKRRRFDFFRERIMFPIRDKRGRVVGFGGRVMGDGGPKYLNSPETRIFHKGHELYGFYQAKQAHRSLQRLMIVEGYMDVVALAQFGIDYAVASLGTATTPEHIQMLFRATSEVVCCYDGDRAGREAAWRALENALPFLKDGVEMKFLFLPDGEDPDTLVRKIGKEQFESKLASDAVPLSKFFFDNLLQRHHIGSAEGKAGLEAEAKELIAKIKADNFVTLLEEDLRKKTHRGSYKADIIKDLNNANLVGSAPKLDYRKHEKSAVSPIRIMIRVLMNHPYLASKYPEVDPSALNDAVIRGLPALTELYNYCLSRNNITTGMILEHFRSNDLGKHLAKLLAIDHEADDAKPDKLYLDCFNKLIEAQLTARYEELRSQERLSKEEKQEFMTLVKTKNTYSAG